MIPDLLISVFDVLATDALILGRAGLGPRASIFVYLKGDGAKGPSRGCCFSRVSGFEGAAVQLACLVEHCFFVRAPCSQI